MSIPRTVCHLNRSDSQGGASKAVFRLHRAINQKSSGWRSRLFVVNRQSRDPNVFFPGQGLSIRRRAQSFLGDLTYRHLSEALGSALIPFGRDHVGFEVFTAANGGYVDVSGEVSAEADLIQLNWVAGILDWRSLSRTKLPIIWRLPDMNPFTGGCHYSGNCEGFKGRCRQCPQLKRAQSAAERDLQSKQKMLAGVASEQMTVICQSRWMSECVAESTVLAPFSRTVISNGVNTDEFHPLDKAEMKRALGFPADIPTVLLAGLGSQSRNGIEQLVRTMTQARLTGVHIAVAGQQRNFGCESDVQFVGDVPQALMAAVYNASDLLLFPSLQDNCPNTVLEAQACGVPVLAFDGSGTAELIDENQSGWLVPCGDFSGMISRLRELLRTGQLHDGGDRSATIAGGVRPVDSMVTDYLNLYSSVAG